MESMIAKLLEDFERGKMTRRQLINSLAVVGTIASNATALAAEKTKGFKAVAVNHISYQGVTTRRRATSTQTCWG